MRIENITAAAGLKQEMDRLISGSVAVDKCHLKALELDGEQHRITFVNLMNTYGFSGEQVEVAVKAAIKKLMEDRANFVAEALKKMGAEF